jgi:hypothetical protein
VASRLPEQPKNRRGDGTARRRQTIPCTPTRRLERRRLIAADWRASDTGREAKSNRLTRAGRAALEAESASWQRLTHAVGLILELDEGAK